MKLVGKVNGINRRAAEHTRGDKVATEKRGFMVQLRPAMAVGSYFGYGSMDFYLNGRELDDFSVDLGDTLDVYLLKQGESDQFEAEDLRRQLREAEAARDTSAAQAKQYMEANQRLNGASGALNEKLRAAATVNAQLMAQAEALKVGRADLGGEMRLLNASGMEAATADETVQQGSTEGDSPVPKADAQTQSSIPIARGP